MNSADRPRRRDLLPGPGYYGVVLPRAGELGEHHPLPVIEPLVFQPSRPGHRRPTWFAKAAMATWRPGRWCSRCSSPWAGPVTARRRSTGNGYLDKPRASSIGAGRSWPERWCRCSSRPAAMAGATAASLLLGALARDRRGRLLSWPFFLGLSGNRLRRASFIPRGLTKSEQAPRACSLLMFLIVFMSTAFGGLWTPCGGGRRQSTTRPGHVPDRGDPG